MVTVKNESGEDNIEWMLRKFKKEVDKEGIIKEVRERRYFEKESSKRHKKETHAKHELEKRLNKRKNK